MARLAIEVVASHIDEHTHHELSHGVGVLTRRVLDDDVLLLGILAVDRIEAGTSANDNLQVLGSVEDLSGDFVGANDHGVHVLDSVEELLVGLIFLQEHYLVARALKFLLDALYSLSCERLSSCN